MVESTDTFQSISPLASAPTCNTSRTLSHVPSLLNRAWRFHTVCHGPNPELRGKIALRDPGEVNRPGVSGDSDPWEGWSHVREHFTEVSA